MQLKQSRYRIPSGGAATRGSKAVARYLSGEEMAPGNQIAQSSHAARAGACGKDSHDAVFADLT
jgi:hypothetical protein